MNEQIAHVVKLEDGSWSTPHLLNTHLLEVEKIASSLASGVSTHWVALAGRWHDLGKYQAAFQDYIRNQSGFERENAHIEQGKSQRVTHSTAGAIHAIETLGKGYGHLLAYLIAGHHAGLPDWSGGKGSLSYRLTNGGQQEYLACLKENIPEDILRGTLPKLPIVAGDPAATALWLRMLFSALVDADFLDTEAYMQPHQADKRNGFEELAQLQHRFFSYMSEFQVKSEHSQLNSIRNHIYQSCIQAATKEPGVFSLTVPTGGGKTLSSLGFALEHARIHGKRRIVYAIPFTSIIEQNAKVFRDVLGDDAVLEHHSNLDQPSGEESNRSRLACENWNAPLIVTTNVQLFESLHASRSSRCRKLHNLRDAVIVLDEAQQIPRDFHAPIVRCMKNLTQYFGVTWVLCTATQPDFSTQKAPVSGATLLEGFEKVHEICEDPTKLAVELQRVEVNIVPSNKKTSWEELALQLLAEDCVLAIVNTRRQARELFSLLPDDASRLHLSAQMCAAHRTATLDEIKLRLCEKREGRDMRPLRVISTQLVEAGVDVDFPVVYRAMAGLDSIAQSAGRCNREGKLEGLGRVVVFNPPELPPVGFIRQSQQATLQLLNTGALAEPLAPEAFKRFFRQLNNQGSRDKHGINQLLLAKQDLATAAVTIQFREAAEKFRLIDNCGIAVVVPFLPQGVDKSPIIQWIQMLKADPSQKWLYRKLQRYTINLPEEFAKQLHRAGVLYQEAGLWVVEECNYDPRFGVVPPMAMLDAESTII
ncbi:CRISPR-associated helicase Cas3' [Agarivorans sp. QJM3NY_29]|uniref:CRISPR-associated helicase Cas3' n=1 Tax=unclassified Agarivorans TaxID=2636026 RepID=UPI003D7E05F4